MAIRPTEIPPADGHTSGRRLALAEWLASRQNPLTARVMVNRIWHHHFGRGIVAHAGQLRQDGRPADASRAARLAGGGVHQPRLEHQADAPADDDLRGLSDGLAYDDAADREKDPQNNYLWRFRIQRLDAEVVRDSIMAASGSIDLTIGGPPVFPHVQEELLTRERATASGRNQPDGPAVWRRSVYVYRKRGLPFPMFQVFDLPEQNITSAARNVSTVPTQALTLLNNDVRAAAGATAGRSRHERGGQRPGEADRSRPIGSR